MTIKNLLEIRAGLVALNEVSGALSAKSKWNLARNLQRVGEVWKTFEQKKGEIVKAAAEGADSIDRGHPAYAKVVAEVNGLLEVEDDVKLLHFDFADVIRDDVALKASDAMLIESLLDGTPAE